MIEKSPSIKGTEDFGMKYKACCEHFKYSQCILHFPDYTAEGKLQNGK